MATNTLVPVALPESSDDYIASYGTATVYLEYGTASPPTDGTATSTVVSGTERYDFWVSAEPDYYYRFRVGDGIAAYTAYSDTFQVPTTYATLDQVMRAMDFPDESRYDEVQDLLVAATDYITTRVCGGRSFFRDPVGSGETTKTLDISHRNQSVLSLARGRKLDIVSLSAVTIADYTGDTGTSVSSGDTGYYLYPDDPRPGWPYSDLVLSDQADDFITFPTGRRIVSLTGVFGWSSVPDMVRRATVDLVRHMYNSRGSDEPVGMSAFGAPIFAGMPKSVRDLGRSDYAWQDWIA